MSLKAGLLIATPRRFPGVPIPSKWGRTEDAYRVIHRDAGALDHLYRWPTVGERGVW
jgi:hypothetical protein